MTARERQNPDPQASTWINPAAQERSARTLRHILNAAMRLLNERNFDDITIVEICDDAGCTPPSFYQRFKDKEALLHALHERYTNDNLALLRGGLALTEWEGGSVELLITEFVRAMQALEANAGGLRRTAVQRSKTDSVFAARIRTMREAMYGGLSAVLATMKDQFEVRDTDRAARFMIGLIQGTCARHEDGRHLEAELLPDDEMARDLARLCLVHLGASPRRGTKAKKKRRGNRSETTK